MTSRAQITFRGILPSDAVREIVDDLFALLCSRLPANARCHVVVDRAGAGPSARFVCARVDIHGAGFQICAVGQSLDISHAVRNAFRRAHAHSARILGGRSRIRPLPGAIRL
jgi:hypothetical protein